eukprot:TRINITY_DN17574_c0_g1_i1.p1 TRINITY_DN17574_c0_g1~~TRINITY_DN17574_c0_g1_i1.p1  ORF type:complete len:261 (-),score=25.33 TRINITY_DN17574_c0_g1_i1:138-890(-)
MWILAIVIGMVTAWNYDHNGDDWDMGWCSSTGMYPGTHQSPIEITQSSVSKEKPLEIEFHYDNPISGTFSNSNGHYYVLEMESNKGYAKVKGLEDDTLYFVLENVHFHTPAEHTLSSTRHSIEGHFVHRLVGRRKKRLDFASHLTRMVIAVVWDSSLNEASSFLTSLNIGSGSSNMDLTTFLTGLKSGGAYYYMGSLTTPTCDEIVNWVVMKNVQPTNSAQLTRFSPTNNYRKIKDLNGRTIYTLSLIHI